MPWYRYLGRYSTSELGARLWQCRLCWSITYSVFLLILAIESVILIPSAYNFKNNALQLMEQEATAAIHATLLGAPIPDTAEQWVKKLLMLQGRQSILGLAVLRADGSLLGRAGEVEFMRFDLKELLHGNARTLQRLPLDGAHYQVAWREEIRNGIYIFSLRLDSSRVNAELAAYVLRIAGLVALIVVVVTLGTMLVLYRSVLSPVLRLRASIVGAAGDPDHAEDYHLPVKAMGNPDELNEVFAAHNNMLSRVAESKRTDRLRAEEHARFLALHDSLTGLPNRNFFLEQLDRTLRNADEGQQDVYVLAINLVGFSAVNDALGQNIGDQVLRETAHRLNQSLTADQFLARLGNDEFALVNVGHAYALQAARRAEELISTLEKQLLLEEHEIRLRCRIGIAHAASDSVDAEMLLHDAQVALRRVGTDAAIRYQFFSPDMTLQAQERRVIEIELRRAFDLGHLQLHYQPKVSLKQMPVDKTVRACEALLRWHHAERGWISPGEFIPVAEECGLIAPLGIWVLRETCNQIRSWLDAGFAAPRVAINLAAQQFRDPEFPRTVRNVIEEAGINPELLEFEITESAAMGDPSLTMAVLAALRDIGVQFSIDDFGTGYSSLSYLCKFEFDTLKIDKSFVDDIGKNSNADAICDAIIRLGQSLGKILVAEGVETNNQADFLRRRRCDQAQGYLFAKPMPAAEIADRLALVSQSSAE